MGPDVLFFFEKDPAALELYEVFETKVLAAVGDVAIRVQKTQVTFTNVSYKNMKLTTILIV